jgi:hypothetical protein
MSKDHPQNGPSLSKAPAKKRQRIHGAPSPDREAAELDEAKRMAAFSRRLRKDPSAILELLKKK